MSRKRALRIGDPVPADAVEFILVIEELKKRSPERYRSLLDCITSFPPNLSLHEKFRRITIALGSSKHAAAASAAPFRRNHLRIVRDGRPA